MKKAMFLFMALLLASCGSDKTAVISQDTPKALSAARAVSAQKPTVRSILAEVDKGRFKDGELLVKFKAGVSAKSAMGVHSAVGSTVIKRGFTVVPNLERVALPAGASIKDAIVQYMQNPNVEYAEPNYLRYPKMTVPNDPYFDPQQWALRNTGAYAAGKEGADIKATDAWDITTGDKNVVIALIDSGIDLNHPDLVNNIWRNTGETSCTDGVDNDNNGFIDDCVGWNFADNNNVVLDDLGHGTHVAGVIGAAGNNGTGIAGVMWNVRIMPLKFITNLGPDVCGPDTDFCGDVGGEVSAIQYAVKNGAKVINASFGSGSFSQAEFDAINSANDAGLLLIAAAGNGSLSSHGENNDLMPLYPAAINLPNIISVAATDQNDMRASFSNYGPDSVHVAAPGVYILSTVPVTGVSSSFTSFCTGSAVAGYDFCSGTSMAAPLVSGLAGLLYSYYPDFTSMQVRDTILRYVDVLPSLQGWIHSGGRINAFKALSSLLTPSDLVATATSSSSISLSWTDNAAGEEGYTIEREAEGGDFVQIADIGPNSTNYSDSVLDPSSRYTYRVRAHNSIGSSANSNEASATTLASGQTGNTGDGGGGCSLGGRQNAPTTLADAAVLVVPVLFVAVMRMRRRRQ